MAKQTINNIPGAVPPLPVFCALFTFDVDGAVISNGTVYVSGSIGCDNDLMITGGIQLQTRAALENMKAILKGAGSCLDRVLKVNVYLTNFERDFKVFNEIYLEYFNDPARLPARTCVGVAFLPMGAFVEVECIAEVNE